MFAWFSGGQGKTRQITGLATPDFWPQAAQAWIARVWTAESYFRTSYKIASLHEGKW